MHVKESIRHLQMIVYSSDAVVTFKHNVIYGQGDTLIESSN